METMYRTGEVRLTENAKESRKVQFVISDESKDRHRTVLNMDGWNLENFNRNGIVGYQHDVYGGGMCEGPDPDRVIGTGRAWIEENGTRANGQNGAVLMGEVEFEPKDVNPLAEKIFQKVLHGTLKATSVGFSPIGGGTMVNDKTGEEEQMKEAPYSVPKGHTFRYEGQELLEFSIVNIPSNPNALKKNLRNQTANALHFVKRQMGQDISYGEIEQMKVLDVIRMLETGEKPKKDLVDNNPAKIIKGEDGEEIDATSSEDIKKEIEQEEIQEPGQGKLELYKRKVKLNKIQTNGLPTQN